MIKSLLKREEEKSKKENNPNKEDSGGLGQHSGTYLSASNPEGYSECYPGIDTSYAMDDSDEEDDKDENRKMHGELTQKKNVIW